MLCTPHTPIIMALEPKLDPPKGASRAWEALTPSLSEWVLDAVSTMGFTRMTPVQASTIPLFLGNKDVVVEVIQTLICEWAANDFSPRR